MATLRLISAITFALLVSCGGGGSGNSDSMALGANAPEVDNEDDVTTGIGNFDLHRQITKIPTERRAFSANGEPSETFFYALTDDNTVLRQFVQQFFENGNNFEINSTYDSDGKIIGQSQFSSGTEAEGAFAVFQSIYTYDGNRVTNVDVSNSAGIFDRSISFEYNDAGQIARRVETNPLNNEVLRVANYAYSPTGWIVSFTPDNSKFEVILQSDGQIDQTIARTADGETTGIEDFIYNEQNELVSREFTSISGTIEFREEYFNYQELPRPLFDLLHFEVTHFITPFRI